MSRRYRVNYYTSERNRERFPGGHSTMSTPFPPELIHDNMGNLLYRAQTESNTYMYIRSEDIAFIGKEEI